MNNGPKHKLDQFWFGLIVGIAGSFAGMVIYYVLQFKGGNLQGLLALMKQPTILSPMISLGAVANVPLFFYFLNKHWQNTAYGIILALFMDVIMVVVLKVHG